MGKDMREIFYIMLNRGMGYIFIMTTVSTKVSFQMIKGTDMVSCITRLNNKFMRENGKMA